GALIALGAMFVLRQWVHIHVDLTALKASTGPAEIGQLPAASLPIVAAVLAAFFELDNTPEAEKSEEKAAGQKAADKKVRVAEKHAEDDATEDEKEEVEAPAKKKR